MAKESLARDSDSNVAGLLVALAYPDRIAKRRADQAGRFLLRNGGGASLPEWQPLARAEYLACAELDGQTRESRVYRAAPLALEEIETHFSEQLVKETVVEWDAVARAVSARRRVRLGALVLREAPARDASSDDITRVLLDQIRREGMSMLSWSDGARRTQERLEFVRRHDATFPVASDEHLVATLDDWLAPHLDGIRRADELQGLDLSALLLDRLSWAQRAALDSEAPTHVTVPSGSRIPVSYADPAAPVLAVRLQELFGLQDTPRVGRARTALTLHLLSPAHRPVQVTRDLAGFWRNAYFDVRKDLKGRYPKHHWPDDPLVAVPTARAKRRGE
jgi:ATP-dependent helicase HrpB